MWARGTGDAHEEMEENGARKKQSYSSDNTLWKMSPIQRRVLETAVKSLSSPVDREVGKTGVGRVEWVWQLRSSRLQSDQKWKPLLLTLQSMEHDLLKCGRGPRASVADEVPALEIQFIDPEAPRCWPLGTTSRSKWSTT